MRCERDNIAKLTPLVILMLAASMLVACGSVNAERTQRMEKAKIAKAMFEERCKSAGEKIYSTVENVEGIFLMKLRPKNVNYDDQFVLDDPYGSDSFGNYFIKTFFLDEYLQLNHDATPEKKENIRELYMGYQFVEAIDPTDGNRYRYTGKIKAVGKMDANAQNVRLAISRDPNFDLNIYDFVLEKSPAPGKAPRYGVTYDDLSTREERDHWIAGSSLKIIDLQTNEVMAERIGYMWDPGQGGRSGGRSPWLLAADYACPKFGSEKPVFRVHGAVMQSGQTRKFATKVLKPIK